MKDKDLRDYVERINDRVYKVERDVTYGPGITNVKDDLDELHNKLRLLTEHLNLEFVSGTFIKKIGGK